MKISIVMKVASIKTRNLVSSFLHSLRTNSFFCIARRRFKTPTLMSLDLHTSVSRDLIEPLRACSIELDRWTISASSHLFHEANLRTAHIRGSNWRMLNPDVVAKFQARYKDSLRNYMGFVVTYTFSFLQIFDSLQKPILAVNATRYESPYSLQQDRFDSLNQTIQKLDQLDLLTVVSNNLGDKDYLKILANIESVYIPNLCDYVPKHNPQDRPWIIQSRNPELANLIASQVANSITQENAFPIGFTHQEFSKHVGVILIPYNISTMRLFELTTAGFPVRIPSDRLLKEWAVHPGVLSELSWLQVFDAECPPWLQNTPADPYWVDFLEWWLARADWNNRFYFPNVTRFDSISELNSAPTPFSQKEIEIRNQEIRAKWAAVTSSFAGKIARMSS